MRRSRIFRRASLAAAFGGLLGCLEFRQHVMLRTTSHLARQLGLLPVDARRLERMCHRWFRGHLGRTVVGVASLLLVAAPAAV